MEIDRQATIMNFIAAGAILGAVIGLVVGRARQNTVKYAVVGFGAGAVAGVATALALLHSIGG